MSPATTSHESGPNYLRTLDGWRAAAILLVLYCHSQGPFSVYGKYGVDLFFAISGLLITFRLADEYVTRGRVALRAFYIRRAFRILPPVLVFLSAISILRSIGLIDVSGIDLLGSLLFFRNYIATTGAGGWWTGHFWSLSVEEHFYLGWPVLLVLTSPRRAIRLATVLALAVAVWRLLDTRNQWVGSIFPSLAWYPLRTDYRLDALLWGCVAGLLLYFHIDLCRKLSSNRWIFLLSIIAIVVLIVYEPRYYLWEMTRRTLLAALMPLPLLLTVASPEHYTGTLLEAIVPRTIGRWSFSMYIWQQLFLVPSESRALGFLNRFPFGLAATFLFAYLSYRFVERPAIEFGRHLLARRKVKDQLVAADSIATAGRP